MVLLNGEVLKIKLPLPEIDNIQRPHPGPYPQPALRLLPLPRRRHRDLRDLLLPVCHDKTAFRKSSEGDTNLPFIACELKIFKSSTAPVPHAGNILVRGILSVTPRLSEAELQRMQETEAQIEPVAPPLLQTAGDSHLISAFPAQRTSVQSAGRHLRLPEPSIRLQYKLLCACLAGILRPVRLPMIKDVVLPVQLQDRSMCISCKIRCRPGNCMSGQADVAVAHQNAAETKASVREI